MFDYDVWKSTEPDSGNDHCNDCDFVDRCVVDPLDCGGPFEAPRNLDEWLYLDPISHYLGDDYDWME